MEYTIYQILDIRNVPYTFRSWEVARPNFRRVDYTPVFTHELEITNSDSISVLEELFELLNVGDAPENYHKVARSLSVSDVVKLRFDDRTEFWYCDSTGWVNLDKETGNRF